MEIDSGFEKIVLIFRNFVIKFPKLYRRTPLSMISIFEEFLLWSTLKDERLAPVIFYIPFICSVMKKAEIISDKEWFERKAELLDYFKSDIFYADIHTHGRNIGRIDGKLVLVDYNYHIMLAIRKKIISSAKKFILIKKTQVIA